MTTQTIIKKIEKLERELKELKKPKSILGKLYVDSDILKQASKALFDFDIEKFVTKKDIKLWCRVYHLQLNPTEYRFFS